MWQKNYAFSSVDDVKAGLREIKRDMDARSGFRDALLHIFASNLKDKDVQELLAELDNLLPNLKRAGMTEFASIGDVNKQCLKLNLMLSYESDFQVVQFPCLPGQEEAAAQKLRRYMEGMEPVKGIGLFPAGFALNVTRFMEVATEGREDLPVFGAMANVVWHVIRETISEEKVFGIGRDILRSGFTVVIYAGEQLEIFMDYILGWRPVGREFDVTLGEKKSLGESCIKEIDGMPALEIYRKYFGVEWDDDFVWNVCEFPLMVQRNGVPICMLPLDKGDQGELYFSGAMYEGEKLCLSYGTQEEVLGAAYAGSERMRRFAPGAVLLSLCGNRITYLREDAHVEWDYYLEDFPELTFFHGQYEIAYRNRKGGILNSSFVAVGFRENVEAAEQMPIHHSHKELYKRKGPIPLPYRMSHFLNVVTGELEEMAKEANAANRAKSAFLSSMSHEIRTPINAVLGMDEMILRSTQEDETYSYALDIETAGRSLLGLVNDILDFSKIEAGKLSIIPVEYSPADMLYDLVNLIQKRAEDKGLMLNVEANENLPGLLYGDEMRIKQIITNILTNAVKYTQKGSVTIGVDFELRDEKNITLKFSVRDTGIGIREEDIGKLFSAFERIEEKRNRNVEGTGLGMNITQELLGMMGSRLQVESVYGEGSVFSFDLEQAVISRVPMGDFRQGRKARKRKVYRAKILAPKARILVVDDTPLNLTVMKGLLKQTQIQVDTATSGKECLSKIQTALYDIIFLDHRMPDMDGAETLAAIRHTPGKCARNVPVIAMTANNVIGARDEYLKLGFSEYLLKPVDTAWLEELIERFLPKDKVQENVEQSTQEINESTADQAGILERISSAAGLDTKDAAMKMGGEELYLQVLKDFVQRIDETADSIENFAEKRDIANYTIKVHALKSSARIIGAKELSEKARWLEEAGNLRDMEEILKNTGELLSIYRDYAKSLSPLFSEQILSQEDRRPLIGEAELSEACEALHEMAETFDHDSATYIVQSLQEYRFPPEEEERWKEIERAVMLPDWDRLKKLLQ